MVSFAVVVVVVVFWGGLCVFFSRNMDEQNNPILVPVFCLRQVKHGRGNWLSLFRYSVAIDSVVAVLIVAAVGSTGLCACFLLLFLCVCVFLFFVLRRIC